MDDFRDFKCLGEILLWGEAQEKPDLQFMLMGAFKLGCEAEHEGGPELMAMQHFTLFKRDKDLQAARAAMEGAKDLKEGTMQ